jgi:hypothetical protein
VATSRLALNKVRLNLLGTTDTEAPDHLIVSCPENPDDSDSLPNYSSLFSLSSFFYFFYFYLLAAPHPAINIKLLNPKQLPHPTTINKLTMWGWGAEVKPVQSTATGAGV